MEELQRLKARIEKMAYVFEAGTKEDKTTAEWLRSLLDSGAQEKARLLTTPEIVKRFNRLMEERAAPFRATPSPAPESCPRCEPGAVCSSCVDASPVSVDRDGLDEAIEAAARALEEYERRMGGRASLSALREEVQREMADYQLPRVLVVLGVCRPLIVKAERERIREAIEGLRPETPFADHFGNGYRRALDAVLAVIDEKGDTDG